MRVVFAGTSEFAVTILKGLLENKDLELMGVITQPDKPKGRRGVLTPGPVKEFALSRGLDVYQPRKIKSPEFVEELAALKPEVMVVAAYGQILSRELLELPRFGCLNVHGSLLPKYRGASPAQFAILQGERESGVTVMQMDPGMDTGAMLASTAVPIGENMTAAQLLDILALEGSKLLQKVLGTLGTDAYHPVAQDDAQATYAPLIKRDMERIDWQKSAISIHNQIRAFNPQPGSYTLMPNGRQLKLWQSTLTEGSGAPGEILSLEKKAFVVAAGTGALKIWQVQPEGKKIMDAAAFLNSGALKPGDLLQ